MVEELREEVLRVESKSNKSSTAQSKQNRQLKIQLGAMQSKMDFLVDKLEKLSLKVANKGGKAYKGPVDEDTEPQLSNQSEVSGLFLGNSI